MKTLVNFFKNKEIRNKIFFTLFILFIYRLGSSIPAPGINDVYFKLSDDSILGMMNLLGGGSLEQMSIFALGVGPYITASIIVELLSMDIIPALAEMAKDGKKGRTQMDRITRYVAVVLGIVQGYFIVNLFSTSYGIVDNPGFMSYLYIAIIFAGGTAFLLWLADQITTKGVGNGVSVIIFAGIVADLPNTFITVFNSTVNTEGSLGWPGFIAYVVMYILILIAVIIMQMAERRIPIQHSSSAVNKTKGDLNHLPLKVNSASVIPVIFASALIQAPQIVASWINTSAYEWLQKVCDFTSPWFLAFYAALIILFAFFYTNLTVDPEKISENLGKQSQFIPGVRPGSETKQYVSTVLNRITCLGSILLAAIALLPYIVSNLTGLSHSAALGGTGIIIAVGVAMEIVKTLKGQLTQKQYKGFVGK